MENFTIKGLNFFKPLFFIALFFFNSHTVFSQYSTKHYIAAAPWDYSSNANEFIVASASGTASVTITKSDGTAITTLSVASGAPVAYRPLGAPASKPANAINTIYNDRGLIFTSDLPIAVSVRNVESDQIGGGNPVNIKGNSSLSSYGNEAIGSSFRVGYYRANFTGLYNYAPAGFPAAAAAPVYSVMAIDNNTVISINGTVLVTLNAGQSYLFQTTIGNLITATKPVVMNSGQWRDQPNGCGDAVLNEIPPVRVLGKNYLVVRGNGSTRGASVATNFPEQTIFIATADNTTVIVNTVNALGVVTATNTYVLPTAGSYQSIFHGIDGVKYSASVISADKNIMVYSGTAEGCEVDMTCVAPVSACTGSFRVETKKFTKYDNSNLPYFGYALVNSATTKVFFNGTDLETIAPARFQIGSTGFYIIGFTNTQLSDPTDLVFTSAVRMSLSMVQQGGGFSMASYLSSFNDEATQQFSPTINGSGCVTVLTAEPGLEPYQWYLNDVLIPGATNQTFVPTVTGSYSVAGTKSCGLSVASTPVNVGCIPIDAVDDGSVLTPFATVISGSTIATSVTANDLLNGVSVTSTNTIVTTKTQGPLSINAAGIISVATGTTNGVYPIEYELCSTSLSPTICDKATAYVKVIVQAGAIAADQTICSGGNPALFTSTTAGVGEGIISYRWESSVSPFSTWTTIPGATSATYDAPTGLMATTKYQRITVSTIDESVPTSPITVTVNGTPTVASAGADQTGATTCGLTTVTLGGNTPTVGTGKWTIVSGAGGSFALDTNPTTTFSGTAGTVYTLRWTITNSPCTASFDDVDIKFNKNPTIANAGLDQTGATTCGLTTVTLGGNTPTVGTGKWTIVSGAGGSFALDTNPTTTFSGTAGTAYTLRWTISNSPCTASSDDVDIKFNKNPTTANAGLDQTGATTCGLTSVTLAGNTPTVGTGKWTILSGTGGSFALDTNPTTTFSGTAGTAYTLRWTISNSPCTASSDDVDIKFNQNPTASITGVLTACLTTKLTAVSDATSPLYVWYKNNIVIPGEVSSTLIVTADGDYKVKVKNGSTLCEQTSLASTVNVSDTTAPVVPTIADATGQCSVTPTAPTTTDACVGTITGTTATVFPITTQGTTVVTWTFDDGNGQIVTADQNIIVDDTTAPVVPTIADATGQCSVTPTAPTTTDACSGTITGTTATVFPITTQGTTVVTWTFDDGNGQIVTADQNIIVDDTTAPVVPTIADATGQCSVTPTAPTTTDACVGTITGTTATVFPITTQGTTVVTWTFDDGNGQIVTADQNIIVDDTTAPVVPTIADATGQCSVTPTAPTTTDACSGTITGTTATVFPITTQGTTVVTWTFDDGNGQIVTADQNVIVDDTTAPVVPTIADATGQCSVTPTAPTTTDACVGTITGTTATVFPITTQGTTVVTWTFDDGNGQIVTADQNVIVDDTTAPVVPTIADATGQCSVTPTAPTTTDACVGTITGTTATVFPITTQGTTVVTWTFDDGNGQIVTADQNIIVDDTTAPVVPTIADATGQCSVTPTAPTTTDACSGTITGTTATVFPITAQGTTVVTWTFDDGNGQIVTADQNVIVDDTTAPVVPTIADATGQCSVTPTAPTTTDACVGTITGTTATVFPITAQGTTVVTWAFDDGNGQIVTADQNVIVDDTTAPVVPTIADATGQCSVTPTAPTTTDACVGTITGTTATVFPITTQGTTVVTWTFDDGNGQIVTADQNIIVDDTTAPVVPTIADATGQCSVTPTAPTTTDACSGTITGTTATVFPITTQGTTVVTWTFDDGNGQIVTADQNIIVDDTTAPVVPTIADATGQCSVTPTAPTTTDACVGTITGTTATVFPITTQGTTVVTWTFDDGNGQIVTADQNIIVDDTTAPVVPTIADATGQCSVTPTAPTTTDACSGTITGTTATVFPITTQGTTVVTWTFDDGNGQIVTADQNVIVDDTTAPVVPTIADATGQCSVTPTAPTTTDACVGTITGTTATVFPITTQGTTVVTWTFDDGNGQIVTADQNVIVDDTTAPVVPTIADATGQCSVTPTAPTTTDACVGTITGTTATVFPITTQGTTVVTWTFDDGNGQIVTADQNIIVDDTTAPVVPTIADATGQCSVTPTAPTTTDACSGTITGTTATVFPITAQGTTVVTWAFDDGNGQIVTADQNVIVMDNINPTIICPAPVNVNVDNASCVATGVALGTPTFTDNCSVVSVSNDAPASFPIGNTTVTWTVKDANNNTATCTQIVTVNSLILANDDLGTPINGITGGTAFVDVLSNDQLNCTNVDPNNVILTFVSTTNTGVSLVGKDVVVAPNTATGIYTLVYSICDKLNATNCDMATVTVTVNAIDAKDDVLLPIVGAYGGITDNILLNDTVNGVLLTAATFNTIAVTPVGVYPNGLTLNSDGTITVAVGTAVGTYTLQYQICSTTLASICDVANISIEINDIPTPAPPVIFADDDLAGPIASINSVQNILNVFDNDFVDLNKATLSNVILSTVTSDPTGYMSLKADGSIELAANTPAGTYVLTYSICEKLNSTNCDTASVTVTVTCSSFTAISGKVYNAATNAPLANVPITLKPINTTTGPVLLRLTKADGSYAFSGMIPGDYVLQVQDANLNAAQDLYNTTSSFLVLKVENCNYQKIDFGYDKTDLLVLGDFVWYDLNNNGIQDEWYDANNDGLVTQNVPDANGVIDYSKWEWIDFNGDGSYKGKENAGELNAAGFGNGTTNVPNIFVTGPNGFSRSVTMGVEGYWRTRAPKDAYGEYKIEFIKEANFEMASEAMSASGLVKVLPSGTLKQVSTNKSKSYVDCGLTTNNILFAQFSATEKVHLDIDFGVSCKLYADILAINDDAGTVDGSKASTGIFNVLTNDTLNGLPIQFSDVNITLTPLPNFTIGTDGLLSTLANIPGGTYTLTYSICEKANPGNCSTATVTVFVARPSIALVKTAHFNDENGDGYAQAGETITYSFEITNTGNTPLTNVTINDPLPGVVMTGNPLALAIGESNANNFKGQFVIKQADINTGSVSNQATVYGTSPQGTIVEDKSDEMNLVDDNPTVLAVSGCAIKVFNAVSPDGSGENDKFYIHGLECYPDNTVEIYNRWGVLVFERDHYNNEDKAFRGTSEGRVTIEKSAELPVGTYFYILKYKDSNSNAFEKSGYLYLNRK